MVKFFIQFATICLLLSGIGHVAASEPALCTASTTPAQNLTLIIARHGEKPRPIANDRGVLNCRGENRALHLPQVMQNRFKTIDAVFTPSPHFTTKYGADGQGAFSLRPFQTALPTATFFNTGVNLCVAVDKPKAIAQLATSSQYEGKTALIVWQHTRIKDIAKHVNDAYGASYDFGKWHGSDFDTLYVFTVKNGQLTFEKSAEGLNKVLTDQCPNIQ